MGTRYNITVNDIEKMGKTVEHDGESGFKYIVNGIAGWDFSSWYGEVFSGPNVFKPELDEIFAEYGIEPEYY